MTLEMVKRADLGWPSLPADTNTNMGMIAHFDGSPNLVTNIAKSGHSSCTSYWKNTRSFHVSSRGWKDIGYAYFVCPHGTIFEGRGFNRVQAAELPTAGKMQLGNSRYVSVTFGLGPGQRPTDEAIAGWHRLRAWLMSEHHVAPAVFGHRDFSKTDCPGDVIYRLLSVLKQGSQKSADGITVSLPVLTEGSKGVEVLTLRSLLFQRFLSGDFAIPPNNDRLFNWLRNPNFTPDLKGSVKLYQQWRWPNDPEEWDGVVGPKTWKSLIDPQ